MIWILSTVKFSQRLESGRIQQCSALKFVAMYFSANSTSTGGDKFESER